MRPWLSGIVAALVAAATASSAHAACDAPAPYPGDDQPAAAVAEWMADGARGAGLPRELPVMGALVASGLNNLRAGDADEAGYFGMRRSIWNGGAYAGFPDRPELQLQWFVDQALLVRTRRLAAGVPDPALDESAWGEWIADVLRPAEQLRGRYALRLAEARELVGPPCPSPGSGPAPAPPAPVAAPDVRPPPARLVVARRQRAVRRGAILVEVACPGEACVASAAASVRLPGAKRTASLRSRALALAQGRAAVLRLPLNARLRRVARTALRTRGSLAAAVAVTVADAAGNRVTARRTVRLTG